MAQLVLELSKAVFPRVGALAHTDPETWTVTKRPLTLNMNELAELANYPNHEFRTRSLEDAADNFEALTLQQLRYLHIQRNDAVADKTDCT